MKRVNFYTVKQVKENAAEYPVKNIIKQPEDVIEFVKVVLDLNSEAVEKFGILTLNMKNKVAGVHIISIGSLNEAIVHPREVYKAAILNNAAAIILFHNHPSGDTEPSANDIDVTQTLIKAGKIMGIKVIEHVIVGENGKYFSFKEMGYIL